MKSRDTMYRVLTDSLPLSPVRCPRKDHTRGICSLCWHLRGARVTETTNHLFLRCPATQQVLAAVWRAFVDLTGNAEERARTPAMSAAGSTNLRNIRPTTLAYCLLPTVARRRNLAA